MACGNEGMYCPPAAQPCVTCCMVCPPPIMAPTVPQPVKPLALPCPQNGNGGRVMSQEEAEKTRYANFYNNYNIDWHAEQTVDITGSGYPDPRTLEKCKGVTTDGKKPWCEDYKVKRKNGKALNRGCPTGFQPCTMKLTPPPGCHPCGVWCAQIQPCPPKPKKKRKYEPGPCKRPCCKHWQPEDGPCLYDRPCKAHCFNHPPGMKPRFNVKSGKAAC